MSAIRTRQSVSKHTVRKSSGLEVEITPNTTEVRTRLADGKTASVTVEGGVTKNLGDYNSARISVSVTMPCFPTFEDARETYKKLSDLVDELMEEEHNKITE